MIVQAEGSVSTVRQTLDISVVIPLYNEEESLLELYEELREALLVGGVSYEILFVDDGSTDGSGEVVDSIAHRDSAVGVVHFRRNFGKASALDAGFKRSRGDVVVTMDADLQDSPEAISELVQEVERCGWVTGRRR